LRIKTEERARKVFKRKKPGWKPVCILEDDFAWFDSRKCCRVYRRRGTPSREGKLPLPKPKPPNTKRKQRQQPHANKGKKNEPPQLQQRISKCNVRRKPKSDENSGRQKNVLLPGTQWLLELQ